MEVLAGQGDLGDDTDLDVLLAGGAQQARCVAAGMEVPAGSRVDIECLGAQQLAPGMQVDGPGRAVGFMERGVL